MKIFWSWQDDSPAKTNRTFIKDALTEAVKSIEGDFEAEDAERPDLDHDTKGLAGAVEIVPALMEKIAKSAVFVADVTPIGESPKGKALPNPNVMVELGWSLNRPGPMRQIYVLNTADGWTIEELPFDIRHRRVLIYTLAESADARTRERVKKNLTKDLAAAIKVNLTAHLDDKAQAAPAMGVAAKDDEPSIWAGGEAGFRHQDSFGPNHWTEVTIRPGPRAYLRVIPSGWTGKPPTAAQIRALDINVAPIAFATYSGGDSGATREGFVRYWISSRRGEPVTSQDVAMYFEATGEFWLLHGSGITEGQIADQCWLQLDYVFRGWAAALRRAQWVLDRFGALPARRVEVGFTGMEKVRWPGGWESAQPPSLRESLKVEATRRDWSSADAQEAFLVEALAETFGLFGLDRLKPADALKFVQDNDHERRRENPFA
ncbi:MAG: hypothetical protein KA105_07325 [Caulobacter sp.]|nr:hypothetical protein [Caulobacter sp.]